MSSHSSTNPTGYDNDAEKAEKFVRTMATVFGAVFLLVGILGFLPFALDPDKLKFLGYKSHAELLGIFQVSILHNIVHLLFGVAGLAMAKNAKSATTYLIGGGVVYLVLTVYGFIVEGSDHSSAANFVPINGADNVLHLVLGVAMIALGLPGRRATSRVGAGGPR